MRYSGSDWPWYESVLECEWSRPLSAWAGFFGTIPYGFGIAAGLLITLGGGSPDEQMDVRQLVLGLLCFLPLMPFVIASAWIDQEEWDRVLTVMIAGLGVGMASILLLWFAGLVLFPAAVLGLICGMIAFFPCWWRGDAAGRAMSVLGSTPAIMFFSFRAAENNLRWMRTELDAASSPFPLLTNQQVMYVIVVALTLGYSLILYWGFLRKISSIRGGVKTARNYAPFALAGGIAGGSCAACVIGMICAAIAWLMQVDIYGCAVSGGIAGVISGATGSTAVMSRQFTFVSGRVAAILLCLVLGSVQILAWSWWWDSFTVLVGGLIGLYEGIVVGGRMIPKKSIAKLEMKSRTAAGGVGARRVRGWRLWDVA